MLRLDELNLFALEQESLTKDKLDKIREDIRNKRITCNGVKERYEVIKTEAESESNNENKEIQEFTTNLNDILAFYDEQLDNIDEAAGKMSSILSLDLKDVELDENISLDEYKTKITNCYDNVILKFNQTSRGIIRFCKILVDIADQNLTTQYGSFENVCILVNLLVKFVLPLLTISKILNECLEQVSIRDEIPTNPNDDDHGEEASEKLKVYAKRLIEKDSKIKAAFSPLLEAIIDGFGLGDEFRNDFYGFMKDYYQLNNTCGLIHLELCAYKMDTKNQVSRGRIVEYNDKVNHLRGKLQNDFNCAIVKISST